MTIPNLIDYRPAKMPKNALMAARRVIDLPGDCQPDFGYAPRAGLEEVCATRGTKNRRYFRWTGWYFQMARGTVRRTVTCEPITLADAEALCDEFEAFEDRIDRAAQNETGE